MDNAEAIALINQWPVAIAKVAAAEKAMVDDHYYRPLTEEYEAAVAEKRALAAKIDAL